METALALAPRPAGPADNAALLTLAAACPMEADVALCIRREPDFFALSRLEGERWSVGVVDGPEGGAVGCIGVAERAAYVRGAPTRTAYVGDLKVHPAHRGLGVADALTEYARAFCAEVGADVPCLVTTLAGNRAVERRMAGLRGLPRFTRVTTLRSYAVPLVLPRAAPSPGDHVVRQAREADLEEMAELWRRVAPGRQFAPVLDAEQLASFSRRAPGLAVASYWLARRRGSRRLEGFVALWDQRAFKATHVLRYAPRAALLRRLVNAVAPLVRGPRLPAPGAPLAGLAAFHVCVPTATPGVLATLLRTAYAELRGAGGDYVFFTLGLDRRDPLCAALDGLFAVPTEIHAYVTTAEGRYQGPPLNDRPLHFETALV